MYIWKKYDEYEPRKKRKRGNYISYILIVIFSLIFLYNGYKVAIYLKESIQIKQVSEEISDLVIIKEPDIEENTDVEIKSPYEIDFQSLKEKNSDVVSFLKVNGTDIEYVVVKGEDNSFYLYHTFDKSSNAAGWIFADYANKMDGTDKNIIIYGHNMKNGTMFGTLKNILTEEWYLNEENRYITYISENETSIYEVFSVYQIKSEDYYRKTDFKKEEFTEFIKIIKSRSQYLFPVDVYASDHILTLSTCATNNKYRVVLHAKKI